MAIRLMLLVSLLLSAFSAQEPDPLSCDDFWQYTIASAALLSEREQDVVFTSPSSLFNYARVIMALHAEADELIIVEECKELKELWLNTLSSYAGFIKAFRENLLATAAMLEWWNDYGGFDR